MADEVLFVSKTFVAPVTPFPIKGRLRWADAAVRIEGRVPLGSVMFMTCWLGAWLAVSVMIVVHELTLERVFFALAFACIGAGLVAAMGIFGFVVERRRALRIVEDILSGKYRVAGHWPV